MAITLEQAKALRHGDILYAAHSFNRRGEPHKVRITGAVKIWKRDPGRIRVPWKHGLYVYGTLTERDLGNFCLTEDDAKAQRGA